MKNVWNKVVKHFPIIFSSIIIYQIFLVIFFFTQVNFYLLGTMLIGFAIWIIGANYFGKFKGWFNDIMKKE